MTIWTKSVDGGLSCRVDSEAETGEVARQIAGIVGAGDVIALIGDLGAGKTRFVKAFAEAWGVPPDEVNSPTFTLIHEYAGRMPIRHCDTYRLRQVEEFADLGLDELFASDGIALVEWADRVTDYLPRDRLEIRLQIDSMSSRTIELRGIGKRSSALLTSLGG